MTRQSCYRHLRPAFDDGSGTLIKPLTWHGDMGFGATRDGEHTFQRLDRNPHWTGIWDLDEAGPHAIRSYFRSYGPATFEHVHYWLGNGLSAGRKRLQGWLSALADQLVAVTVDGETAHVLDEDVDALSAARAGEVVRLLPGHDPWVMGPGTSDARVVPPRYRDLVTRKANLVVVDGVVGGTWRISGDALLLTWFAASGTVPGNALEEQAHRVSTLSGRPLRLAVTVA